MKNLTQYRLSPVQAALYRSNLSVKAAAEPVNARVRVSGTLDVVRIRAAVATLLDEHEILRTLLKHIEGLNEPVQYCVAADQLLPDREGEPVAGDVVDLVAHPDWRLTLHRFVGRDELVLQAANWLLDSKSTTIFFRRLVECYEKPECHETCQYVDIAEWNWSLLEDEQYRGNIEQWRRAAQLSELGLPFLCVPSGGWRRRNHHLGEPMRAALARFAERADVAPEMVVLYVWLLLLRRVAARADWAIGVTFDGRASPELKDALGPLTRRLPFSSNEMLEQRVLYAVQALQRQWDEVEITQFFMDPKDSFEPRVGFSRISRNAVLTAGGLTWVLGQPEEPTPILINLSCSAEAYELDYRVGALDEATIRALGRQIGAAIGEIVIDGVEVGAQLTFLRERAEVASSVEANDATPLLPEQIAAQLSRQGEETALHDRSQSLSYRELMSRIAPLAQALVDRGVRTDSRVALVCDRPMDAIPMMLAIWFSGGAFVPIDCRQPARRIEALLDAASAELLLDCGGVGIHIAQHMDIDYCNWSWDKPAGVPELPKVDIDSDSLAYVVFTSGSTGHPKGVEISHRAVTSYVKSVLARLGLLNMESFALCSPLHVDLGYTTLFASLVNGCPLALTGNALDMETEDGSRVDCLKITPSHLDALLSNEATADLLLPGKLLICGGEPLPQRLVARVRALRPGCQVANHYGPAETTVGVCAAILNESSQSVNSKRCVVGESLDTTRVWVLDAALHPVPPWHVGELYIGGETLARAYSRRAAETAARFLPCPFVRDARMYRTGDVARRLPDGRIEILGRNDRQVKVRGQRVELGEIEVLLEQHPDVEQAVALYDTPRNAIGAFVVPAKGATFDSESLRKYLAEGLPDHMIPRRLLSLPSLPRASSGKSDYRQLEHLLQKRTEERVLVPPANETERQLGAIWAGLLDIGEVGVNENLFNLGAHSLMLVKAKTQIEQVTGKIMSVADLVSFACVREQAALLQSAHSESDSAINERAQRRRRAMSQRFGPGGRALADCQEE